MRRGEGRVVAALELSELDSDMTAKVHANALEALEIDLLEVCVAEGKGRKLRLGIGLDQDGSVW